jgi:progesterone-induced-blocking factor 1
MLFFVFTSLVENDGDADKILFSYGYGASLPTSAKRRLQHSVHLAKRVIQLEQANTSLRLELDRERKKKIDIHHEVLFCLSFLFIFF